MGDSQLLAEWEYEGERPQVIEEGELFWNDRLVRFELVRERSEGERLIFRTHNDDGSWAVGAGLVAFSHKQSNSHVLNALKGEHFTRVFPVDSQRQLMQIAPNGVGFWRGKHNQSAYFSCGHRISKLTSSTTRNWLFSLCSRPSSDVAFAREFNQGDTNQKLSYIFGFATVEEVLLAKSQVDTLCRLVFYCNSVIWRQVPKLYWVLSAPQGQRPAQFLVFDPALRQQHLSFYLDKWAVIIAKYGPLHPQTHRMCLQRYFQQSPTLASAKLNAPTAHEQLEAQMRLGKWASENLPTDVWAEVEQFWL